MKEIKNTDGMYLVDHTGRVYSKHNNKYLSPILQGTGYRTVTIRINGKRKTVHVHRIVAEYFVPNPHNKPQVNHIDLDKENNQCSNLEWVTIGENVRHGRKFGGGCGTRNGNAKLSNQDILSIRSKYASGRYKYKDLAKEHNIMPHYVGRIVRKECWSHI